MMTFGWLSHKSSSYILTVLTGIKSSREKYSRHIVSLEHNISVGYKVTKRGLYEYSVKFSKGEKEALEQKTNS